MPDQPTSSFAQFGEDLVLWEYFGHKQDGFFVEAGAAHPTDCSQTWFLEQRGWSGVLIDPLDEHCGLLRRHRPRSRVVQVALGAPEMRGVTQFYHVPQRPMLSGLKAPQEAHEMLEVEVRTLDDVLAVCRPPRIDLLSIDVEGLELQVPRGFSIEKYRPGVLLLEDHLQSLALHRHVTARGYRLVKRTGCNNWYIPRTARFGLTGFSECVALWKEIHLDTPVRIVRFALKRRHRASRPEHG